MEEDDAVKLKTKTKIPFTLIRLGFETANLERYLRDWVSSTKTIPPCHQNKVLAFHISTNYCNIKKLKYVKSINISKVCRMVQPKVIVPIMLKYLHG